MVSSMTGFGRGQYKTAEVEVSVEMRSVNHRYSDISIKYPRHMFFLEEKTRQYIQNHISRGRVDVYISYELSGQKKLKVSIDEQLADLYYNALVQLKERTGIQDSISLSLLSGFPDVITKNQIEFNEEEVWQQVLPALEEAVNILIQMRSSEGQNLKKDILARLDMIQYLVSEIENRSNKVVEEYRDRLEKRVNDLAGGIDMDKERLSQEVVIFADRSSITEEVVRLRSHILQARKTLEEGGIAGRKLDFIVQEMNREANTIASKASDIEISNCVIDVKSELEKIREQVQNIQ